MEDELIANEKQPLFELYQERPASWSPAEDDAAEEALGATASTCKNLLFIVQIVHTNCEI